MQEEEIIELHKEERERESVCVCVYVCVLAAPRYHQLNLCQSHRLCRLETYSKVSADVALKKPAGSV